MLVQVPLLAVDRRFGSASAAAALVLALALDRSLVLRALLPCSLVLVLGRRFVLRALLPCWCWDDIMSCQGSHAVILCMTTCCAAMVIMSSGQLWLGLADLMSVLSKAGALSC